MKRIILSTLLITAFASASYAFELAADTEYRFDIGNDKMNSLYGALDVSHSTDYIDFFWRLSVCNDGKYQPSHGDDLFFGFYFFLEDGGVALKYNDIRFTAGRTRLGDSIDSPYSLFVSSKIIPALLADFTYDDGTFFFTSRWTELNSKSALGFPDRGWQFNSYGIYLSGLRLGFQDSMVYTGRSFDPEYFLNPLPGFFKQYCRVSPGKPWQSAGDDNSIMGFFGDYRGDDFYAYGQILVDDFNANAFLNPESAQNPNKIAWSFGGNVEFPFGTIGIYQAGATKYTFQASAGYADQQYGYSFYPAVEYTANGVLKPIKPEDSYIGYYNGENNVSLLADYSGEILGAGVYGALEFSLSGEKSPANPWHEYSWWTEDPPAGTKLLDSERLEKKLVLTAGASRPLTELGLEDLVVSLALEAGYIWNVLELADVPAELAKPGYNEIKYWVPSGNGKGVFSLTLGARYRLSL